MNKFILIIFCCFNLSVFSQLPNSGFENWTVNASTYTVPVGWSTSGYGAYSTSDAAEGNKALVVWTWYTYAIGYAYNGQSAGSFDFHKAGTPFTQKAISLTGMYKFDTANVYEKDSAVVVVLLKKYNTALSRVDTVGFALKKLPPANTYTFFTVPIVDMMPGVNPDSVVVVLSSQKRLFDFSSAQNTCRSTHNDCAYFYIDDLALNTANGLIEISDLFKSSVAPNPSKDFVRFEYAHDYLLSSETLHIFDNSGRLCFESKVFSGYQLNVSNFGKGIYSYVVTMNNNLSVARGKFVVTE